jgi:beta-lactamase class A
VFDAWAAEGKDVSAYDRAKLMSVDYDDTDLAIEADERIRTFQRDAAAQAGIFHHLITLPTYHTAALSTDNLAKEYFGDAGHAGLRQGRAAQEIRQGIACVKHQNMSGSDIGDDHKEYFAGEAALKAGGKDNTMNQFLLAACSSTPSPQPSRPVLGPPPVVRPAPVSPTATTPPAGLTQAVASIVRNFRGRVGLAILRSDAAWTIANQGSEFFPQQSVSKLWVALTVLDAVDRGKISLDDPVTVTEKDRTVFNQPIMQYVQSGKSFETTVGDLIRFQMILSDNSANDILLRKVGGPEAVRRFLIDNRLGSIRFGPGEAQLQAGTAGLIWQADMAKGRAFQEARAKLTLETRQAAFDRYVADPVDGASPVAIARALMRLQKGNLLSKRSTEYLLARMSESKTGPERLEGGRAARLALCAQDRDGPGSEWHDGGL